MSADLYTREDGVVIDTFKVSEVGGSQPVRAEKWPAVEKSLRAAIEGHYDVAAAIEKWRTRAPRPFKRHKRAVAAKPAVRFDLTTSASDTVVEIKAEDEPGLAYKIASIIAALGFSIHFAKIATEKSHALDVFYITDSTGQKLSPGDMQMLEQALLDTLRDA